MYSKAARCVLSEGKFDRSFVSPCDIDLFSTEAGNVLKTTHGIWTGVG